MRHRLPSRRTVVDSDIEAVGLKLRHKATANIIKECEQGLPLFGCHIEERTNMPLWNDQAVPG